MDCTEAGKQRVRFSATMLVVINCPPIRPMHTPVFLRHKKDGKPTPLPASRKRSMRQSLMTLIVVIAIATLSIAWEMYWP